ncbi:MAG: N-6 DNA methylase [Kiritimatiellaeota bacterium]|nr:N-6 DNA methylase [Kiritimatiellota bacterium]
MSKTFDQGKDEVAKLCQYFTSNRQSFLAPGVKEAHVRQSLIDPFFEALGWDVRNHSMTAPQYREVITEDSLDVEGQLKAPDYTFRIGTLPKFYVEAKKCGVNISADPAPAFQLRRYGFSAKLALSILTDFDELGVYDCAARPRPGDKASHARIQYFGFTEYPDRWREIWDVFSREAIWSGTFDKYAASKRKRGTSEVDSEFLKDIEGWRDVLARNLALRNSDLSSEEDLTAAVQRIIDRLIFLRMAEDRGLESYGQLLKLCEQPDIYNRFMSGVCRKADQKYNSGLFHFQKEIGVSDAPDTLTPSLAVDDNALKPILQSLYFEHGCPYHFGVMPVEILGTVYERFLGKVIRLTAGHQAKVEEKPEVRKAGGVYYTPAYIVNYIVHSTIGKQIEGKSPADLAGGKTTPPFRILDPACGSGSFLLSAYQFLLDHCLKWHQANLSKKHAKAVYQNAKGETCLSIGERKRILTTHIYGVDIDPQAVETTKLSLLLKALEGENDTTLSQQMTLFHEHERALPNLYHNIKCGNSLIASDFSKVSADLERVHAFDWPVQFPDAMKVGGFDIVIGNPPYVQIENIPAEHRDYYTSAYGEAGRLGKRYDLYQIFVLRGTSLLRTSGRFGNILPNTFLMGHSYELLRRRLVTQGKITELVDLPQGVFAGVVVDNVLLFYIRDTNGTATHKLLIHKLDPKSDKTRVARMDWDESFQIAQSVVQQDESCRINVHTNPRQAKLFKTVESGEIRLGDVTDSSQGIILYKTGSDAEKAKYTGFQPRKSWKRLLRGKNIARYEVLWGGEFVSYGEWLWCPRDERYFNGEKILLHAMRNKSLSRRLVATLDTELHYNAHNLANIIHKAGSDYSLRFVLGVFNSKLINYWYRAHFPNVNINPSDFRQIPLPRLDFKNPADRARHDRLVELVDKMLTLVPKLRAAKGERERETLQNAVQATDQQIDRLVYELYGLTEEEIKIVEG